MLNLAIFVSGRIKHYNECLKPIIDHLKDKYNVKLFLSINNTFIPEVIECFKNDLGYYEFKPFFYEKDWLDTRISNNRKYLGPYNQLSCFYNDLNNFKMIERYELDNDMTFDVICKLRSDIVFSDLNQVCFHKDDEVILNNINLQCRISAFGITPPLMSDAICFGNKKSMRIYCNTYNFIKETDIKCEGLYNRTFEPYLNESLFNFLFYGNGTNVISDISPYSKEEMTKIFNHKYCDPDKKFIRKDLNWRYHIIRKNSFTAQDYILPNEVIINKTIYLFKPAWSGLVHKDFINEKNCYI